MTYATYTNPTTPRQQYPGWEPSDLHAHARIFENERRPEEMVGWEPSDLQSHARQFKPHHTPLPPITPQRNPACMRSLVNDSYIPLPGAEYKIQDDARKGPLSRTVTLTSPFNPFNKLQNDV
ncbi:hypothetical protein V1264_000961 [Littorina saxatilis]|uniref:Uncharacterized protein n=1 Tax=Littorina saxatilis TaxID=31220 RepID=A0AAN9C0G0_9CAEN